MATLPALVLDRHQKDMSIVKMGKDTERQSHQLLARWQRCTKVTSVACHEWLTDELTSCQALFDRSFWRRHRDLSLRELTQQIRKLVTRRCCAACRTWLMVRWFCLLQESLSCWQLYAEPRRHQLTALKETCLTQNPTEISYTESLSLVSNLDREKVWRCGDWLRDSPEVAEFCWAAFEFMYSVWSVLHELIHRVEQQVTNK